MKGEFLFADFGTTHADAVSPNGYVAVDAKAEVRSNVLRVGVDYRF